jgi:hypothetical protein
MARIDTFENTRSIGVAGTVQQRSDSATGRALQQLGNTGASLGASLRADEERAAAKEKARAESRDNLILQTALLDHEDRVATFANDKAPSFTGEGADGYGFQRTVDDFAKKDAEAIVAKQFAGRVDSDEVALRFRNSSRSVVRRTGELELDAGLKFQGDISTRTIAGEAAKIAVNPDLYHESAKRWTDFASSTNMDRPLLQARMAELGLRKLQRARVEAIAGLAPDKFRDATAGAFIDTPSVDLPQHLKDVVNGANDAGVRPQTMLAIGQIESRLNPDEGMPIGKDGKPMSSAEGMFQVLSARDTLEELGITKDQKYDTATVSKALSSYIKRQTGVMESKGIPVTPGKQYMTWNMGPGLALATMQADPNTRMEDIVNRTLRNRSPEFRAKVIANNPSLYKAGMTAGQVVANYDNKMASAAKETEKFVTGASISADDQAHAFFEKLVPGGAHLLGAKDLGEIQILAKAKSAEVSREQQSLNLGMAIAQKAVSVDMRDSGNAKAFDEFVEKQQYSKGLVEGDRAAHRKAAELTDNAGVIAQPFVHAYSAAMDGGDINSKLATYAALADVQARNPRAFGASKIPADDMARANEYVALTTVSNLSPADAVKRIDFYRSPEGKKQAEAQRAGLQSTRASEVKELSDLDVIKHFDEGGRWSWSTPVDAEGKFIAAATDAYKEQYAFYREQGRSVDDAKSMSLSSLDRNWGASRVADSGIGANTQTFMPYPPEKAYRSTDVGHSWITDQAKNAATAFVEQRYPKMAAAIQTAGQDGAGPGPSLGMLLSTALKDSVGVKLVPDITTAHEARANKPQGYLLVVRLPNGETDGPTERFYPDQVQADRENAKRFSETQANRRTPLLDGNVGAYIPTPRLQ